MERERQARQSEARALGQKQKQRQMMNSGGGFLRGQPCRHAYAAWAPTHDASFHHQHQPLPLPPPQHHSLLYHGSSTAAPSFGPQSQIPGGGDYYASYNHDVAPPLPVPDGRLAPHLQAPSPAMEGPAPLWGTYHQHQGPLIDGPWGVQPGLLMSPYAWQHADAAAAAGWGFSDAR